MTASLLPIPDDPRFNWLILDWPGGYETAFAFPRSVWLGQFERLLREFYPQASSRDLKLTARHNAPFPLAAGKDVP